MKKVHEIRDGDDKATATLISREVYVCQVKNFVFDENRDADIPCPFVFPFETTDGTIITDQAGADAYAQALCP